MQKQATVSELFSEEDSSLAPLTELLQAHAMLIIETSEKMAEALSHGLDKLTTTLMEECGGATTAIDENVGSLLTAMQLQDVLRQQAVVLVSGLDAVAKAQVPSHEKPEEWYMARLKEIEAAYVMQAQFDIHSELLGTEVAPPETEEEDIFF